MENIIKRNTITNGILFEFCSFPITEESPLHKYWLLKGKSYG